MVHCGVPCDCKNAQKLTFYGTIYTLYAVSVIISQRKSRTVCYYRVHKCRENCNNPIIYGHFNHNRFTARE